MARKINDIALHSPTIQGTVIGRQHIAFLRGYLEGVALSELCKRYGQGDLAEISPITANNLVRMIREQLAEAARSKGKQWRQVRLLSIDPQSLAAGPIGVSLDEFRFERDPDGFYQEQELLEMYREEYGGLENERIRSRNDRLRRKQVEVLNWLDVIAPRPPRLIDPISYWLAADVSRLLEASGILQIAQLRALILSSRGWWKSVAGLGGGRAIRIERWLHLFHIEGRPALPPIALHEKHSEPSLGIVPLEFLKVPDSHLPALGPVLEWLKCFSLSANGHTLRVYRREVERFALFTCLELSPAKHSAEWQRVALDKYSAFLDALSTPLSESWPYRYKREMWVGPRHAERASKAWRPFEGPLCISARTLSRDVVKAVLRRVFGPYCLLELSSS